MADLSADSVARDPETGEELLILWELVQTAHLARRSLQTVFSQAGLASTQFGILACLADGDDFTKAELARALMVRPQSIDPTVESLVAAGLVERDGPPRRGRAAGIGITAQGRHRLALARTPLSSLNALARLGLDVAAATDLVLQLRAVRQRLDLGRRKLLPQRGSAARDRQLVTVTMRWVARV